MQTEKKMKIKKTGHTVVVRLTQETKYSADFSSAGTSVGLDLTCIDSPSEIEDTVARGWEAIDFILAQRVADNKKILRAASQFKREVEHR